MGLKSIYRGDTKKYLFRITDILGAPVDISDNYLYFTLKVNEDDDDDDAIIAIRTVLPANAESVLGVARITIPSTDTDLLTPDETYYYDFQYVIPGVPPYVQTLQAGKVKALQDVTLTNT